MISHSSHSVLFLHNPLSRNIDTHFAQLDVKAQIE